ncbi:flavonol 4'-sulfotransferase-like [Punica granatum]|uniref:Sulfotransferase n=1 Tax=Punica granatum TaxID=22663 RepID=A0A6P8BSB9_PUNGR|nr:flavonol 4'-sulfotransferase-like [Punica granatum]
MVFGPFWTHILGYWNERLKRPDKVLFLKYDPVENLNKMADFMGVPFSKEKEKLGVIEEIVKMCSLSNLKELEVNKTGKRYISDHKCYFRKGKLGDWVNYFSPSMAERLQHIMDEKLSPLRLPFKLR